jgi:Ca2+-binding EF-hand superfamily protein
MSDIELSDAEIQLREQLLSAFVQEDASGSRRIHATQFQGALQRMGLQFGNEVVDRVLLLCKIDDQGVIDFSAFQADVQRRREEKRRAFADAARRAAPTDSTAPYGTAPDPSAGKGYEFHTAIERTLGKRQSVPDEITRLPRDQRVKRLASDIQSLFNKYDTGYISLDVFRAKLRGLGVDETPEAEKLLKQGTISFTALLRALSATTMPLGDDAVAGEPSRNSGVVFDSALNPLGGKRHVTQAPKGEGDVVAWRGVRGGGAARAAGVPSD